VGGFITWSRARVAAQNTALDQITLSGQPDLALFSAMSIVLGLIGSVLFLRLLSYVMQPWYFLSFMAVLAAGADAAQSAAPSGRGFRVLGIALAAVGLTSQFCLTKTHPLGRLAPPAQGRTTLICNMQKVKSPIEVTMMTMIALLKDFLKDETGQGLTEYLLVVALIALATIVGMNNAATSITSAFNSLGNKIANYIGT